MIFKVKVTHNEYWLPPDLTRVVLEFAGSLIYKPHRLHRFVQLELQVYNSIQMSGRTAPSRLVRFYRDQGFYAIQEIIKTAFKGFRPDAVTQRMRQIC